MNAAKPFAALIPACLQSVWRGWLERMFVLAALVILAAPMVVQFSFRSELRRGENRAPASFPESPASLAALPDWTAGMDAWLRDNFGLRKRYLDALDQIHYRVFGGFSSPQILMGRDGRIFLASHVAGESYRNSLIRTSCGGLVPVPRRQEIARSLAMVLERSEAAIPGQHLAVLVPSSPVLYPSALPAWLERQCRASQPLLEGIVAALPEPARARVVNLHPLLAALDPATPAIPRQNFHWAGTGPMRSAAWIAETKLGRHAAFPMPTRVVRERSDITGFFPGVRIVGDVTVPNAAQAGVTSCIGPPCFETMLGADTARLMEDLRRYDGPGPEGRLLVLSDSFGAYVAESFTPYFREVLQVSLNNLPQLSAEQRGRLRHALLAEYRPDVTLYLFHDFSATYAWDIVLRDLLPPP